jgi:hypothetical protein
LALPDREQDKLVAEACENASAFDRLIESLAVKSWADLANGDGFRFFPALRLTQEDPPPELVSRVLARAAEIERNATLAAAAKRIKQSMEERNAGAGDGGGVVWSIETTEDAKWIRSLVTSREVRDAVQDLGEMARFAFLTGFHPAYLWSRAEILPSWGATAAWLGELSRKGRAFMSAEVADYLIDAVTQMHGRTLVRDVSLSGLLEDEARTSLLLGAARRCLSEGGAQVRCQGGARPRGVSVPSSLRRVFLGMTEIFSTGRFRRFT